MDLIDKKMITYSGFIIKSNWINDYASNFIYTIASPNYYSPNYYISIYSSRNNLEHSIRMVLSKNQ